MPERPLGGPGITIAEQAASVRQRADKVACKAYRRGTHRILSPEVTLANVVPFLSRAGITRVANVTGLDRIGIPVVSAARPNSRSISVSQGKGLSLTAAKASAIMEAIETFVAESVDVVSRKATLDASSSKAMTVDWRLLPRQLPDEPPLGVEMDWCLGTNLLSGEDVWLPAEIVHTDYTLPQPAGSGWFFASSNGLASGNNSEEALVHALCEVIERDCRARWIADPRLRIATRIAAASIADDDTWHLLDLLERAGMDYGIWDLTGSIGVPVFLCTIRERGGRHRLSAQLDSGSGCHPCREVALMRAITEAAQMRLTYLTGARDDQGHEFFASPATSGRGLSSRLGAGGCDFESVESVVTDSPQQDLQAILDRLSRQGYDLVLSFVFPVSRTFGVEWVPFSVVRIVVPGLAGPAEAFNEHLLGPMRIR